MITEIKLTNFKCFKEETTFPLSKVNLLTGVNGRGKSTLLQSLLLMRQTIEHAGNISEIIFNGSCVRLGTFEDVKNSDISIHEKISIFFKYNDSLGNDGHFQLYLNAVEMNELIGEIIGIDTENGYYLETNYGFIPSHRIKSEATKFYTFDEGALKFTFFKAHLNCIHYIAADRIGPKDYYSKNNLGEFVNVGPQGENTAMVLARKQEDIVYDELCLGKDAKTVLQQTEEWLNQIFDGAKIKLEVERNIISISYNTKPTEKRYKPSNVGFGYSYILPIIVSGLIAQKEEILIIENPEAHLHPKAQSQLSKFLAKVASCGVQVYIESHSEHILNALRVVSLDDDYSISHEDISVLYFKDDTEQPFIKLNIEKDGSIKNWVDGFFDQQELDLSEIFKLSRARK